MSHTHPYAPGTRSVVRGRYAKPGDIRYLASVIQQHEQSSRNSTSRLMFLIDGKPYSHNEVARRVRRARNSGRLWLEESTGSLSQPSHIEIFTRPMRRVKRLDSTPCTGSDSDRCEGRSCSSPIDMFERWAEFMDETSRYWFLHLVRTEHNMSPPTTPSYPDELFIQAKFFFNIIKYFRGAYDNGQFVHNDLGELVSNVSATSITKINNFYKCCITAIDLIERGYHVQGFALVSDALWLIEQLLEERDPKLIDTICDVSVLLLTRGWNQMYDILNERICAMVEIRAAQRQEKDQPWAQMFACLRMLPTSQALELMQRGWKCGYDQLEGIFPGHPWDGLNISCSSNHPLRMGRYVSQLHQDILSSPATSPQRHNHCSQDSSDIQRQFTRAKVLYSLAHHDEALRVFEYIISRCTKARKSGEEKWMALEIDALEASAKCHYALSNLSPTNSCISTAETLLKTAITRSTIFWRTESATTIALKHTLWQWYMDQSRCREADMLRKAIDDVVIKSESRTPNAQTR